MANKNNTAGIKKEFSKLGTEITLELIAMGMDEIEIMNFWQECVNKVKSKIKYESLVNN